MKRFSTILPMLAGLCVFLGFINFFAFMATSSRAGGSALNGYVLNEHYYLDNKGRSVEVSATLWERQRLHEASIFITHPLTLLAMGYLVRRSFAGVIYRAPLAEIAQTVALVRASTAPVYTIDCAGSIGPLQASGPLLHTELYPNGLVFKVVTLAPCAIRAQEITTLRSKKSWFERGIEINHSSSQIPSPIRLLCENDEAFCTSLEEIAGRPIQRPKTVS